MPAPLSAKLNFYRTVGFTTRGLNQPVWLHAAGAPCPPEEATGFGVEGFAACWRPSRRFVRQWPKPLAATLI